MDPELSERSNRADTDLSRRDLLRGAGVMGAGALASGVLAACGGSSSTGGTGGGGSAGASNVHVATDFRPQGGGKRGGTIRLGVIGGSTSDTLSPWNGNASPDWARAVNLYDQLVILNPDATIGYKLATEIAPNRDATEWTVRIRPDVTFHNGKPLTADDVIYSYQTMLDPKAPNPAAPPYHPLDRNQFKKLDKYTVRLGCHIPFSTFVETNASMVAVGVIPVGFDLKHPIGTGPWMYESFTPGQQSVFVRNPNYWQQGVPYADRLVMTDYATETAQLNALQAGQVDAVDSLSAGSVSSLSHNNNIEVLVSRAGGFNPFTMWVDSPPFSDVRVRQAMRLLVNRPQMNEEVFLGYGTLASDVFAPYDPDFNHALPQRTQDLEKAKFLLKQAGYPNLAVNLYAAAIAQGTVNMAQVLAEQASGAGVKLNIQQLNVSNFFGPAFKTAARPLSMDINFYLDYLPQVSICMVPGAAYNETGWRDPTYVKLYYDALATTDPNKRRDIVFAMQNIDYNSGSYIIPMFPPVIDGYSARLKGVHGSRTGQSLGNYDCKNMWLD